MRQTFFALLVVASLSGCRQRLEIGRIDDAVEGDGGAGGGSGGEGGMGPVVVERVASWVNAGSASTCARSDSHVACWGSNEYGQLATGSESPSFSSSPLTVTVTSPRAVYGGSTAHCAAITDQHFVECWGTGAFYGEFEGMFYPVTSYGPFELPAVGGSAAQLTKGIGFTCALTIDGRAKCWGYGSGGVLGNGTTDDRALPTDVSTDAHFVRLASSTVGSHTCGVTTQGQIACWGTNSSGQLGHAGPDAWSPQIVAGISDATRVATGRDHSCAASADGSVRCWGDDTYSQLGAAPFEPVPGLPPVAEIAAGGEQTCALTVDGEVWCWGAAGFSDPALAPHLQLEAGFGAIDVSVGAYHACAVNAAAQASCWGDGPGGSLFSY